MLTLEMLEKCFWQQQLSLKKKVKCCVSWTA